MNVIFAEKERRTKEKYRARKEEVISGLNPTSP